MTINKDSSEKSFQDKFVEELTKYKWKALDKLDGNKHTVTVEDLINNWRGHLNRLNAAMLEGVELTDNEFAQVLTRVNQLSNSYEAAKLLAAESNIGKIDGIYRDKNPGVTKEQITLTIFKKAEVRGGDSVYEIAREVCTSKKTEDGRTNRFDIVLLINGLPLINIEQKRTDKSLDEAFGQFKRYYKNGEYTNNFMAFSQMMVISTEQDTRYFATPKSLSDFNKSFVFTWADKSNRRINQWEEVIKEFLMIPMAHQMIGDYLVIDEAIDPENRRHMLLRPYQVYAIQAIEAAVFGWDNKEGILHGGFIWHTTGSGKTITSFKTALILSTRSNYDNVIFLVDRRDLDSKTTDNFKGYAAYEGVDVDDTPYTTVLKRKLTSKKRGIIVTTTFKLNSLVKEMIENHDDSLSKKKFIFIIDEAHRTTMGQMMVIIRDHFRNGSLFFGFTGTPLFDENNAKGMINTKSEIIDTTEKLFGPLLHKYTIDEAIKDGNVLGFHVDYVNTGEFVDYNHLRDELVEKDLAENPYLNRRKQERYYYELDDLEVEKLASEKKILYYLDKTHIPRVVTEILDNWDEQSQNRQFTGMLTVAYKNRVIAYYEEFKRQLQEKNMKLNIALTFSYGNPNDPDNVDTDIMQTMFDDYAKFTGIQYIFGRARGNEEDYFEDVISRSTRGGSGRNPKNIDLLIVADQLLTGYDSKRLNTLYVDRRLELQGLIQAYSRTNRVYGPEKEFGTVINFRFPKQTEESVNKALKLYGSGGESSTVIMPKYEDAVIKLREAVDDMKAVLPDPSKWVDLEVDDKWKEDFLKKFLNVNKKLTTVRQYYEFEWIDADFNLSEYEWLKYIGAYKNLTPENPVDPPELDPDNIKGKARLSGTQVIDAQHILNLIGEKTSVDGGHQYVDGETLKIIYEQIQELSNLGSHQEAELIKEFVEDELLEGNVSSTVDFDEAFEVWKKSKIVEEITDYSLEWGIDKDLLLDSVEKYDVTEPETIPYIDEILENVSIEKARNKVHGNVLSHAIKVKDDLVEYIPRVKKKF